MTNSFISAPSKKGFEVKLSDALSYHVRDVYGEEQCNSHMNAFNDFNALRSRMLSKLFDKHESSLDILKKYHDQFVALEYKIPLEENGVRVDFKWEDAFSKENLFGKRSTLKQASGAYERICVLYNIAAVSSQVAETQNLNDEAGLKSAVMYYQQAAGIFSYLRSAVPTIITREPTLDFNSDTLSCLSTVMLAQAQELIYIKSVKDQKNNGLIGKLAKNLAELYADGLRSMQLNSVKSIWPKEWIPLAAGKEAGYHAMSEFYTGKDDASNQEFGNAICRFKKALDLMKASASRAGPKFLFKTEQDRIKRELETIEKENNMIYHCNIPAPTSLPDVSKLAIAKEIAPTNPLNKDFKDMFSKIVPLALHSSMMNFESKKKQLINAEVYRLKEATDTMSGVMTSLNLPAAVEDSKDGEIPETLLSKAAKVRSAGGIEKLEEMMNGLPDIAQRNVDILKESIRMLDSEEDSDSKLRQQFKEKWGRTHSKKLTEGWKLDIKTYEQLIEQAKNSDATVRNNYTEHSSNIRLLSEGEAALKEKLPKFSSGASGEMSTSTKKELKRLCEEVESLKRIRIDLVQEAQQMETGSLLETFTKALAEDSALNEEQFAEEQINKMLQPLRERVRESLKEQETLLAKIQEKASQLGGGGASGGQHVSRAAFVSSLIVAADKYEELIGNLEEGQKFYIKLTDIFLKFQNKVQDFCFARKTEKDELMKDLQSAIVQERSSDNLTAHQPTFSATSGAAASTQNTASTPPRPPPTYQAPPSHQQVQSNENSDSNKSTAPAAPPTNQQPAYAQAPSNMPYPPSPYMMPGPYMPGMPAYGAPNYHGYAPSPYMPPNPYGAPPPQNTPGYQPGQPGSGYQPGAPPPQQQQQYPGYPYYQPPRY